MTTYVYETIPKKDGKPPLRFEMRQAMTEAPLKKHPKTGERVRRVIAGGYGFIAQKAARPPAPCGCGRECERCDQN